MTDKEKFLDLYKTYEGLLREHGKDYRAVEESADDLKLNRMRMMRQMRNYLSHNADAMFLAVSKQQIQMLESLIKEEQSAEEIVKKHLLTPKRAACMEGDNMVDILLKMSKLKAQYMPVTDKDGRLLGLANVFKMAKTVLEKPGMALDKKSYGAYEKSLLCVTPDTPVKEIREQSDSYCMVCCTSDGTCSGKFLGIWKDE